MSRDKFYFVDTGLALRRDQHRLRRLRPVFPVSDVDVEIGGRRVVNFCANDYLGLSKHPLLKQRAAEYASRYGTGATASRLICGNYDIFSAVEDRIAALKGSEAALVLNSGYQANISLIPALTDPETLILSDRLNHNSLIQGVRLSRCTVKVYRHNDVSDLGRLLEQNASKTYSRIVIVTESVFSMDGDISDLAAIKKLADAFDAILVVDDAHATGVMGKNGMGLAGGHSADVVMGTFSKGGGAFGAYVTCSNRLRDYFINCCSGFIYSTALPPPVIGAVDAALELIPEMDAARTTLRRHADKIRSGLANMGFDTGASASQIIPVMIGGEKEALALSEWLFDKGILASAIRPPTVPDKASRIRISLSAAHQPGHIDRLLNAFRKWQSIR